MDENLTLSIDCGGLFLKSCVLDSSGTMHSKPNRIPTPYPLPPATFVETIAEIASGLPKAYRATIGMPGMIRNGVVISTPHYKATDFDIAELSFFWSLNRNVMTPPGLDEQWLISLAHGQREIDIIVRDFLEFAKALRA